VLSVKNTTSNLTCHIFPNPSDGHYQLEILSNQNDLANLTITDITGRIVNNSVQQINAGLTLININISESGKGVYFVKVNTSEGLSALKMVKE
jgi:hypothetical protein